MRAISQTRFGGSEVLELVERERPVPGPGEVLVEVAAASVNPLDWKIRSGQNHMYGEPPFVLGVDVSGTVVELGPGVDRFAVGDEVFGMPRMPEPGQAYAEYLTAPADNLARRPASLDHVQASALASSALTSWQALVHIAGLTAGQRVLVHAAAGGVGHLAVQIAKAHGAHVLGTARADKHGFLRGVGVDEPIDYTAVDFVESAKDIDIVLDLIGGEYGARSLDTLRPGGVLVSAYLADPGTSTEEAEARGLRFAVVGVAPSGADLERIAALVDEGRLAVHVASVFPLEEAAKAHDLVETGRVTGKVVLTP
ncbi:NADP-dependent oxidoreductase [Yinghuangia seranimata]|nr:NADP-dependent oxidoreductase [Yinghuangia seranimata]MDI2125296.1 NADP-dependent oxidoreductase [Yinghuangia seranimata]